MQRISWIGVGIMGKAMVQGHMPVGITAKTMADRDIAVAVMVVVSRNKGRC